MKPLAVRMLDEVRKLTLDLRPTVLDDLGLIPAIRWYADHRLKPQGVKVHLETSGDEHRLSPEQETALFRVMQEAMNNVVWHAEAENVVISVDFSPVAVAIEVEDDGKGFDLAEVSRAPDKGRGLGLMGMRERVALFYGNLTIDTALGAGTRLRIEVPVEGSRNGKDQSSDRR
jgi:two-component system, NarL family, sensor histidine kinase UhpB